MPHMRLTGQEGSTASGPLPDKRMRDSSCRGVADTIFLLMPMLRISTYACDSACKAGQGGKDKATGQRPGRVPPSAAVDNPTDARLWSSSASAVPGKLTFAASGDSTGWQVARANAMKSRSVSMGMMSAWREEQMQERMLLRAKHCRGVGPGKRNHKAFYCTTQLSLG